MKRLAVAGLCLIGMLVPPVPAAGIEPVAVHGFLDLRGGCRTGRDPHEKDLSMLETRLQVELYTFDRWAEYKFKGDAWADGITEQGEYDTREAWVFSRPAGCLDIKLGRQVLTWGTGELVFLNDLFPKDWQSFFIGRDAEYLKAPSDALKVSLFFDAANLDVVYTPRFDPDRYVTGEYLSYWSATRNRLAGRNARVTAARPDRWLRDAEVAARLYRNIRDYEYALYGYWGFWKSPAGQAPSGRAAFPELQVYGASARGRVGPGIGNAEIAWYRSVDDERGTDAAVRNSELRYLVGYAQEVARDCHLGLQYYVEQMLAYRRYRAGLSGSGGRDRIRHVVTLQWTGLLMHQNLEWSLSAYLSPSDRDAYLRPLVRYKYSDHLTLSAGANIFCGHRRHTFFAQFADNSNLYLAVRYGF